jgi:hypothetical protein
MAGNIYILNGFCFLWTFYEGVVRKVGALQNIYFLQLLLIMSWSWLNTINQIFSGKISPNVAMCSKVYG